MKTQDLRQPEGAKRSRKRVGRGIAAGQGKSAGYGTKGQKSRTGRGGRKYFEGGQLPLVRRLPFKRGFHSFTRVEYAVVNVEDLVCFEAGTTVDTELLIRSGLVRNADLPIKLLGRGEIDRALTVRVDAVSGSARDKVVAAGGQVEAR
ncbi:MAG: 50S ribosomal protein L15 [Chloroflexi bacterium]|nr:50S ribosomal protein L15 [Chloroflexota bacterium]